MRYLPGIDIERDFYSLGTICRNMKDGRIGYDRDGMEILLNNKALSKIIESIFIGIPLPSAYINGMSEEFHWEAITGHTVFEALNRFVVQEDLGLEGLEIHIELNGLSFKDLHEYWKDDFFEVRWDLIVLSDREVSALPKESKKKNAFLAKEDIYAIIKEFNG